MSRKLEDMTPELQDKCKEFLMACSKAGHPVIVTQTYRSFEEQEALYAKGRSLPGQIVTHARAGDSLHNYRMAFDICFLLPDYKLSWEGPWDEVGKIGQDLGLEWGGAWEGFVDKPHFQFTNGLSLATLKARYRIPLVA